MDLRSAVRDALAGRGSVTTRRLYVLASHLPPEAAVWDEAWSQESELLATLVDRQEVWWNANLKLKLGKRTYVPEAMPRVRRPGDKDPEKQKATPEKIKAFFSKLGGKKK